MRIAIIGGGIGGLTAALILSLVPNVLTERFLRGVFDYDAYAVSV